jgi:hypothetical protein
MKAYYLSPSGLKQTVIGYIPSPDPTPFPERTGKRFVDVKALLDRALGPGGGAFVWHTHKGKSYKPSKMATPHLFYALRMVWNHSVPPIWKVGDGPDYSDVPHWNKEYRRLAIQELAKELVSRDDAKELDADLRTQFHEMILKTLTILQLGL